MWNTKGEKNPRAKLTMEKVKEIRRIYRFDTRHLTKFGKTDQGYIAKKFGVSRRTISYIVNGEKWNYIEC